MGYNFIADIIGLSSFV